MHNKNVFKLSLWPKVSTAQRQIYILTNDIFFEKEEMSLRSPSDLHTARALVKLRCAMCICSELADALYSARMNYLLSCAKN